VIPLAEIELHNVVHHLNFIPIMLAGMLHGRRGALVGSGLVAAVQVPHIWLTSDAQPLYAVDRAVELAIFSIASIVAGFLSDRERAHLGRLERTRAELEQVYEELRQNVERLRKAERLSAAGHLSAGLAHEIRNPLASIAGAAGILSRGNASSTNFQECLEIIDKESNRLNKLLSNFLEFARPRAPKFQRTEPGPLLDSVVALARHSSLGVDVRNESSPGLPEIECDGEQLKQVLLNLVINAAQASTPGSKVRIVGERKPDRVAVSVIDEGSGVAPQLRDRLFDPFFTTREKGTGLGLAIASRIIEQHGGTLVAEPNPDRGMTFRAELPLDRSQTL